MELKQSLQQFGLTKRKADVYLASLELGLATVIEISKKRASRELLATTSSLIL